MSVCSMLSIAPIPILIYNRPPTTSPTRSTVWRFLKLKMSALDAIYSSPKRTSQTTTLSIKTLMISLLPMILSTCPQQLVSFGFVSNKPTFHWDASFKQVKIESGLVITATQLLWKYFRLTFPTVCKPYKLLIKKQTPSMFGTTSQSRLFAVRHPP